MTTEQKEAPEAIANGTNGIPPPIVLPDRDVRRKRPPLLSFVLRLETLRRTARVLTLLALDFVGVVGALFTALGVKLAFRGEFSIDNVWHGIKPWIAFAYLVTVLMFARVDLYADRPRRPGTAKIATALFQATVIALVFALANGQHFSSYYIFYGSLIIGIAYIGGLRQLHLRVTGWVLKQAGYQRRALIVGSGKHIEAVAHALSGRSRTRVAIVGYISLTAAAAERPEVAWRARGAAGHPRHREGAGGDHRRPRFPAGARRRPRRPVPSQRRHRPCRAVDDGDPVRPRRVRARSERAVVHAAPARVRGHRLRAQADASTSCSPRSGSCSSPRS